MQVCFWDFFGLDFVLFLVVLSVFNLCGVVC